MCHCFCCCGYIFRKINWHILSVFSISLAMVKTDVKNIFWRVFFSRTVQPFFVFLWICVIYLTCYNSWVLILNQKVVHCVLSFWLVCVMLKSYMLMLWQYLSISSDRASQMWWLCVITANTGINPNQKQH